VTVSEPWGRTRIERRRATAPPSTDANSLGTGAAATLPGLAGCAFGIGAAPTTVDVSVTNDDANHTVDAVVEFGDEAVLDEQFIVAAGGEQTAVFANPDESGDATVSATVHDGASTTREIPAGRGSGLASVAVVVGDGGTVEASAAVR
jgi:hypothetical protein